MKNNEYITRFTSITAGDDRQISGTAIVFDVESQPIFDIEGIEYTEVIKRGAITQELINNCDILLTYNHEEKQAVPLARSNKGQGSLKITVTDTGVDFSCRLKNTTQSNEIYEAIRQGDLSGCSFKFRISENSNHKFTRKSDGTYLHEIYKIGSIRDLSIVTSPAYAETSVFARQLQEQKTADEQQIQDEIKKLELEKEQQRQKEIQFQKYLTTVKQKYLCK